MKKILVLIPMLIFGMGLSTVSAQNSSESKPKQCCSKSKKEDSKKAACCSSATASNKKTSGCSPSACRGAKTKFGEAKVITALRESLVDLKADMEVSATPKFEAADYDIHDIVGESDDESLDILIKHVQQAEQAFASKAGAEFSKFELPESKAKQVLYLNERIAKLKEML